MSTSDKKRRFWESLTKNASQTTIGILILALALLLGDIILRGAPHLTWEFLNNFASRSPQSAGIKAALFGTIWVVILTALFSLPIGILAGVWLEEYAKRSRISRIVEVNISNLAGVPSIIYGLLGLGLFVRALALDRSILSGSLTMALLVLPIIVINTREAMRGVPRSYRDAGYALGCSRTQVVFWIVLRQALPGILTGTILALSRAIGETAPLITIGALTFIAFLPEGPKDPFTVLPIQIFNWISRPQADFRLLAAAGIILLLFVMMSMNATAIYFRNRLQRRE